MSYRTHEQPGFHFSPPRITWAVQRLIFLCTAVFALQVLVMPVEFIAFGQDLVSRWFSFHPVLFVQGQVWRPFTYIFLHAGLLHLFLNMLWLFIFGPEVERVLGTRGFIRFFMVCGVLSVMATYVPYIMTGGQPYVAGASGAVMAVLVAFAVIDPDRQFYLFPLPIPVNVRALVIIVLVMNLISAMGPANVSVATHFGGMIVGYLYMKFLPRLNAWLRERRLAAPKKKKKNAKLDKIGEEVDNIFKFQDRDRH